MNKEELNLQDIDEVCAGNKALDEFYDLWNHGDEKNAVDFIKKNRCLIKKIDKKIAFQLARTYGIA